MSCKHRQHQQSLVYIALRGIPHVPNSQPGTQINTAGSLSVLQSPHPRFQLNVWFSKADCHLDRRSMVALDSEADDDIAPTRGEWLWTADVCGHSAEDPTHSLQVAEKTLAAGWAPRAPYLALPTTRVGGRRNVDPPCRRNPALCSRMNAKVWERNACRLHLVLVWDAGLAGKFHARLRRGRRGTMPARASTSETSRPLGCW